MDELQVLQVQADGRSYELGRYIGYLLDPTHRLTISDVATGKDSQRFQSLESRHVNLGVADATLWLRFSAAASGEGAEGPWLLDLDRPQEQTLTLYYPARTGGWQSISSCRRPPCQPGATPRQAVFRLPPLGADPTVFYLRINTKTSFQFFPQIITPSQYREKSKLRFLAQGLYYGLCLALILYNLSIFIFLRDWTYLWYVLYVLFLSLYLSVAHGLAVELIPFGEAEDLVQMDLVCLGLSILIVVQFARSFLMTGKTFLASTFSCVFIWSWHLLPRPCP